MIDYDPFSPEAPNDPLPVYRRLRDEAPCYFIESRDTWALSRFEDVWHESGNTDHYTSTVGTQPIPVTSDQQHPMSPMLHFMDPPQHTQLVRELAKHMGASALREHEVHIQGFVDELVDAAFERGRFDMIDDVAFPLAAKVLALMCGLPIEDTALAQEIDGKPLGDDAGRASHLSSFLRRGSTVFSKGFGAVAYRLFTHPDQRQDVALSPDLALPAFLEALRMDTPTQMRGRVVKQERKLHGQTMLPGHGVLFLYASAGRDEREYPNPDHFDVFRRAQRTVAFGTGPHACIGGALARREGDLLLRAILKRMPDYVIDDSNLEVIEADFVRGWKALPVSVS